MVWALRVLWASLPFTVGPALADALDAASRPVQVVASVGLWLAWAVVVMATLVPRPVGLTALRAAAPVAVAASVAAAAGGHRSVLALGASAVTVAVAFLPEISFAFVNGAAYPNERRYVLRVPGPLLLGLLPLTWVTFVLGAAAGPLLLAARQWALGAATTIVGVPLAFFAARSMHSLSRRWAVFVPAGMVLHDPLTLADPVLFQRSQVAVLRPAPADAIARALDLTMGAPGLALELALRSDATVAVVAPRQRGGRETKTACLLFTPTRPGAVLKEAGGRRYPASPPPTTSSPPSPP